MPIELWAARLERPLTAEEDAAMLALLPPERRERLERLRQPEKRREPLCAYLILCRALWEQYRWRALPPIRTTSLGKPYFPDHPDVHFNLSHTAGAVLVALSDRPVGVDIERIRPVSPRTMRRLADVTTGVAVILRTEGENRIVLHAGANHALAATDVVSDLRRIGESGDIFVTQGECDPAATEAALRAAHEQGLYTIYNPAPARPAPDDLWPCVDLVCLNETECQIMCGVLPVDDATCLAAARRLRELGAGTAVITLGAAGSFGLGLDGEPVRVPAAPANVVDTTAAGDTFIGALAAGRARGFSLAESMEWGARASALTVSRLGAQPSIPTAAEVEAAI